MDSGVSLVFELHHSGIRLVLNSWGLAGFGSSGGRWANFTVAGFARSALGWFRSRVARSFPTSALDWFHVRHVVRFVLANDDCRGDAESWWKGVFSPGGFHKTPFGGGVGAE